MVTGNTLAIRFQPTPNFGKNHRGAGGDQPDKHRARPCSQRTAAGAVSKRRTNRVRTGLAILAMSLAFFVVYVGWIYPNKEVGEALGVPVPFPTGQQLPPGGLGPPPANGADKAETAPPVQPK